MRLALDSNVLAYAEGVNGASMQNAALDLVAKLNTNTTFLPVQVLGELFNILVRKARLSRDKAAAVLLLWQDAFPSIETSQEVMVTAIGLACRHQISIWDAVVLSAAASADCRLLLSEDLQDGFTWSGVTVVNPFAKTPNELLTEALNQ